MSRALLAALCALLILPAAAAQYDATIKRTDHGIPHITASDYGGLGYGYGYAFAQDNISPIAETYVTVRGERARYFGPDGEYEMKGNGFTANNCNSTSIWLEIKAS